MNCAYLEIEATPEKQSRSDCWRCKMDILVGYDQSTVKKITTARELFGSKDTHILEILIRNIYYIFNINSKPSPARNCFPKIDLFRTSSISVYLCQAHLTLHMTEATLVEEWSIAGDNADGA